MTQSVRMSSDSASAGVKGAVDFNNQLLMTNAKMHKGTTDAAKEAADKAAANKAKLDQNNADIEKKTQLERVKQQDDLTGMLGSYTDKLKESGEYLTTFRDAVMGATNFLNKMTGAEASKQGAASTAESRTSANQDVVKNAMGGKGFWGHVKSYMGAVGASMANASDTGATVGSAPAGGTSGSAGTATTPPAKVTLPAAGALGSAGGPKGASQEDLAKAGFKMKAGDVQATGAPLSSGLLSFAKKIQETFPGFTHFNSFDDMFHQKNSPDSKHAKGLAVDFALGKRPTEEEGKALVAQLKQMGASLAIDEYNHPSGKATGGHMHAEVSAEDGAMVSGPKSGYPATLHGNELITPLDKNTVFNEMLDKLDQMVKVLKDHKDISEKTFRATT